jgi:hypothetical protein
MALPINFLHHPLPGTQSKTSVTFGCGYLTIDFTDAQPWERIVLGVGHDLAKLEITTDIVMIVFK